MDEKETRVKGEGAEEDRPKPEEAGEAAGGESVDKAGARDLPPVSFSSFVFSLSASALLNLGELKDPSIEGAVKDPVMAKHTIDIIGMLKDKTKGNLDENEAKLMENVLHDLRLRYLKVVEEDEKKGE